MKSLPLIKSILDFIYPPLCLGCADYTESEYDICCDCLSRIKKYAEPLCLNCGQPIEKENCKHCEKYAIPVYAYGPYLDPLKEIIIQFKFKGLIKTADLFAELLVNKFQVELSRFSDDILLPIPLHPTREATRGYNQAEIFCTALAKRLDMSFKNDLLIRTKGKKPQARLKPKERHENIKGSFSVTSNESELKEIILVDDVVTTGATLKEAIKTLQTEGHSVKAAIALAHAE